MIFVAYLLQLKHCKHTYPCFCWYEIDLLRPLTVDKATSEQGNLFLMGLFVTYRDNIL